MAKPKAPRAAVTATRVKGGRIDLTLRLPKLVSSVHDGSELSLSVKGSRAAALATRLMEAALAIQAKIPVKSRRRVAFVGTTDEGYPSEIVWATTRGEAKSQLASKLEVDYLEVTSVKRLAALDDFTGDLTEWLLEAGWYWECTECQQHTGKGHEGFVRDGEQMFCSQFCKDKHDAHWAQQRENERLCREKFAWLHPGVPILRLWTNQYGWWVSAGAPLNKHVTVKEFPR